MRRCTSAPTPTLDLSPTVELAEDDVGIGGPDEGFGLRIVVLDEAVDGGLEVERNTPRLNRRRVRRKKKVSTALSHEHEVGVKWKTKRGCRASQRSTLGCLWVV